MKKRILFTLSIITVLISGMKAQKIAGFENSDSDLFNQIGWEGTDGSFGIVDNPSKTGINSTSKCLLNHRIKGTSSGWKTGGSLSNALATAVILNSTNRYLHVLIYSDQSYAGYIKLRYTAIDNEWLDPSKEARFNFTAGKWTDLVIDLQPLNITAVYGLYFLSLDWYLTYPTDSYFYYDEIEVTNNPNPRGATLYETACTVSDFETNGISPSFIMSGSNGGSVPEVVDNPDTTGINQTSRSLRVTQKNEGTWWCRATLNFNIPVKINSNNRYLHLMVKSPTGVSVLTNDPVEHWFTNISLPKRDEWCDVVVDMMATGYNLNNTVINSISVCANSNTYIPDMVWYIDEVTFSNQLTARTARSSFLDQLTCTLTTEDSDWNFVNTNPVNTIQVTNTGTSPATFILKIDVRTAAKEPYRLTRDSLTLAAGESKIIRHELMNPEPGFYRYYIDVTDGSAVRNKLIRQIGYNPGLLISLNDAQPDFDTFWDAAKKELAGVAPEYKVTYKQKYGSHLIYDVEMKSIKGKTIKGYLSVPDKTGKFPGIVLSNGFGVTATIPDRTDDYVTFTYNIRGMGLSTDYVTTDDVFVNGLKDINSYYYRESYMDAIRAVDFICSRPEVDVNKILAEGESQGGALTFVIGALDPRIKAIAPRLPFLSDFPVYYKIKENVNEIDEWPMNLLNQYMAKYALSKESTFRNLSYFDIKNLAGKIKCPVLMCVGLQDPTCPPSINFAAFNQVQQPKEYMILKNNGHYSDATFITYKDAWFKKILGDMSSETPELDNKSFDNQIQTYNSGDKLFIYSATQAPVNITIYQPDGTLSTKTTFQASLVTSVPATGIYLLSFSDRQHHFVRKIIIK